MALREFVDVEGRRWRVWQTIPSRGARLGEYGGGWLTFDDGTERRRLAPLPEGWVEFTAEKLALLVRIAQPSPSRGVGYIGLHPHQPSDE